ncbi:hypothetical protein ACQZ5N_16130 [Agrobacterium sp. 22-221-1]
MNVESSPAAGVVIDFPARYGETRAYQNKRQVYSILFEAATKTLRITTADRQHSRQLSIQHGARPDITGKNPDTR